MQLLFPTQNEVGVVDCKLAVALLTVSEVPTPPCYQLPQPHYGWPPAFAGPFRMSASMPSQDKSTRQVTKAGGEGAAEDGSYLASEAEHPYQANCAYKL